MLKMSLKDATLSIARSILSQYVVIKRDFCSDMFKTIISVGTRMPNKRSLATIVRNSNFLIVLNRVMKNSRYDVFCLHCCDIFESSNYIFFVFYTISILFCQKYIITYPETWINLRGAIINYYFFFLCETCFTSSKIGDRLWNEISTNLLCLHIYSWVHWLVYSWIIVP